jgi:hypothetical protein
MPQCIDKAMNSLRYISRRSSGSDAHAKKADSNVCGLLSQDRRLSPSNPPTTASMRDTRLVRSCCFLSSAVSFRRCNDLLVMKRMSSALCAPSVSGPRVNRQRVEVPTSVTAVRAPGPQSLYQELRGGQWPPQISFLCEARRKGFKFHGALSQKTLTNDTRLTLPFYALLLSQVRLKERVEVPLRRRCWPSRNYRRGGRQQMRRQ